MPPKRSSGKKGGGGTSGTLPAIGTHQRSSSTGGGGAGLVRRQSSLTGSSGPSTPVGAFARPTATSDARKVPTLRESRERLERAEEQRRRNDAEFAAGGGGGGGRGAGGGRGLGLQHDPIENLKIVVEEGESSDDELPGDVRQQYARRRSNRSTDVAFVAFPGEDLRGGLKTCSNAATVTRTRSHDVTDRLSRRHSVSGGVVRVVSDLISDRRQQRRRQSDVMNSSATNLEATVPAVGSSNPLYSGFAVGGRGGTPPEAHLLFGGGERRVSMRQALEATEMEDVQSRISQRQQHDPVMVRQKRLLVAVMLGCSANRMIHSGLGRIAVLHREGWAAATLHRLVVPLWRLYHHRRRTAAEVRMQGFIMRVVARKRRLTRHQSTDVIRNFLVNKLKHLRPVIKWYVNKIKFAQRCFRRMLQRRDAQVQLNFLRCRDVEQHMYWPEVNRRSNANFKKAFRENLNSNRAGDEDGDGDGASASKRQVPTLILKKQVRVVLTQRSRDWHRELTRRQSAANLRVADVVAFRRAQGNVLFSPNTNPLLLEPSPPNQSQPHVPGGGGGSGGAAGMGGSHLTSAQAERRASMGNFRLQYAVKLPHYRHIMTDVECFAALDESCIATAAIQADPSWTSHINTQKGERTKPSGFFSAPVRVSPAVHSYDATPPDSLCSSPVPAPDAAMAFPQVGSTAGGGRGGETNLRLPGVGSRRSTGEASSMPSVSSSLQSSASSTPQSTSLGGGGRLPQPPQRRYLR